MGSRWRVPASGPRQRNLDADTRPAVGLEPPMAGRQPGTRLRLQRNLVGALARRQRRRQRDRHSDRPHAGAAVLAVRRDDGLVRRSRHRRQCADAHLSHEGEAFLHRLQFRRSPRGRLPHGGCAPVGVVAAPAALLQRRHRPAQSGRELRAAAVGGATTSGRELNMLLRLNPGLWAKTSEPPSEAGAIDAGLRAYTRSFAVPLVALAVLGAVLLVLTAWLAQLT